MNFAARTIQVRGGKGGRDGVGFFGAEVARYLRAWLARRSDARPEDSLSCDRHGRTLTRSCGTHILHHLSVRAGLPRKVGPHAPRHHAATAILRQTGDLELVRQVLRHESLTMARGHVLYRTLDDLNNVVVVNEFSSTDEAKAFMADPSLPEAMKRAGVEIPAVYLCQEVEDTAY